jgi:hypothetical protein
MSEIKFKKNELMPDWHESIMERTNTPATAPREKGIDVFGILTFIWLLFLIFVAPVLLMHDWSQQ